MPIVLTPAAPVDHLCGACEDGSGSAGATPAPVPCSDVGILSVNPATLNGSALRTRLRSVTLQQGQCSTIEWVMHDKTGKPVDLTGCGFGSDASSSSEASLGSEDSISASSPKILFRMSEYVGTSKNCYIEIEGDVVDAANGKVRITLTKEAVHTAGVYYGEIAMVDGEDESHCPCIVFSNVFFVVINRGQYGGRNHRGAPTIAEVRLHIRDSSPAESYLLEGLAFDDAEIAFAIQRPIDYWNEIPPPLSKKYTTENFPHRYHWMEAIVGNLFLMAEESNRRNQLEYSAGGISINDMSKERNYGQAAQVRLAAWREFVRQRKASDNLADAFGEVGSPYGY